MKKLCLLLVAILGLAVAAQAQQGNTVTRRFPGVPTGMCGALMFAVNNGNGDLYDCFGTSWTKVGSAGGGGASAGPTGSLQFAGAAGAFAVTTSGQTVVGNNSNCDGAMVPCSLFFTSSDAGFAYFMAGTNTDAPVGNFFSCKQDDDAGVYCDSTDATNTATFAFAPGSGNSGMNVLHSMKRTGFDINSTDRVVEIGRLAFTSTYTTALTAMAFSLGANWGNTASVTSQGGSDNAFLFQVTTGGTGIAANPTVTYTYVDGDFSTAGASTPVFICQQTDGNDIIADVTDVPGQTSVALTWHGTPTTGKTYTISCIGFQRS